MEEGAVVLSIVGAVSLGIALFQFGVYAGGPRVYFAGGTATCCIPPRLPLSAQRTRWSPTVNEQSWFRR